MATNIHLPDALIKEAMELTNIASERELVETAVKELIRKAKVARIKKFKGQIPLDNIDMDTLRGRKRCPSS